MLLRAIFCSLTILSGAAIGADSSDSAQQRALDLLDKTPLIDGHNDLPWQYFERFQNHLDGMDIADDLTSLEPPLHTDLGRLRRGRVGAQFWSVYIPIEEYGGMPGDAARVLAQMDVVQRLGERYPEHLELAFGSADIRRIQAAGRIASLMGIEGGHAIEDSLAVLRSLYAAGARYMTLTHGKGLRWADSATDEHRHGGLTPFGQEVVGEMNRLGMLVDLSHVTQAAMHDALDTAQSPVIFSHSSARAVVDHPRNVPDDVLQRLRENGGLVMVTFVTSFVSQARRDWDRDKNGEEGRLRAFYPHDEAALEAALQDWVGEHPAPAVSLADVADHIDHIRSVAGIAHIGIGGDFDGIESVPSGLEDVSMYPALFAELLRRGYSDDDIAAIAANNLLRVLERNEVVAQQLQQRVPASDRLLGDSLE